MVPNVTYQALYSLFASEICCYMNCQLFILKLLSVWSLLHFSCARLWLVGSLQGESYSKGYIYKVSNGFILI